MAGKSKRTIGQMIQCTQCGEMKPWQVGVFKSEKGKPRMPCIPCDTRRRAANAAENREREREAGRERMAKWRADNPEKVKVANRKPRSFDRELARTYRNKWRRENPDARIVEFHKRKARMLNLPNSFTKSDWKQCLKYWGRRCCVCGRKRGNGFVIAMDHWIPLSDEREDNPGTVPWNIVPMCHARNGASGGCNNSKWIKDPIQWLTEYVGEEKAQEKLIEIEAYFETVTPTSDETNFAALCCDV